MSASRYLHVYDIDTIYSWTPRQFKNFMKGAQLREADNWEREAANAFFTAKASNSRKTSVKELYDADKARKEILTDSTKEPVKKDLTLYNAAKAAMKNYRAQVSKEGG